jgi:hypothetical protein
LTDILTDDWSFKGDGLQADVKWKEWRNGDSAKSGHGRNGNRAILCLFDNAGENGDG